MSEPETICDACSTPLELAASLSCKACGITLCDECGAALLDAGPESSEPCALVVGMIPYVCPNCGVGAMMDMATYKCAKCGAALTRRDVAR